MSYASGHLIFADDETLIARPFDPKARQVRGEAFLLPGRVTKEVSRYVGASASANGTLVYGQAGRPDTAVDLVRSQRPRARHAE